MFFDGLPPFLCRGRVWGFAVPVFYALIKGIGSPPGLFVAPINSRGIMPVGCGCVSTLVD